MDIDVSGDLGQYTSLFFASSLLVIASCADTLLQHVNDTLNNAQA